MPIERLDRQRQGVDGDRSLQRGADALEHRQHAVGLVEIGQQQAELVAAEAGERVRVADRAADALGDLDQQLVAGGVAERIVDLLEAVEVHQQDRQLGVVAPRVADRLADALAEQDPVGQPGERIVQRLVLVELGLLDQLALGALALGDVLDHRHRTAGAPCSSRSRTARTRHHVSSPLGGWQRASSSKDSRRPVIISPSSASTVVAILGACRCSVNAAARRAAARVGLEHLLERRVDLDDAPVAVHPHDADRGALEQGPKARQRLGLAPGGPRARRRGRPRPRAPPRASPASRGRPRRAAIRVAAHHVERPDHLGAAAQGHADQRLVADRARSSWLIRGSLRGVLDQQRLAALDRVAGDRGGDRPHGVDAGAAMPLAAAGVEIVAVDQVDHRAVGADDRLRALGDELHHATAGRRRRPRSRAGPR